VRESPQFLRDEKVELKYRYMKGDGRERNRSEKKKTYDIMFVEKTVWRNLKKRCAAKKEDNKIEDIHHRRLDGRKEGESSYSTEVIYRLISQKPGG